MGKSCKKLVEEFEKNLANKKNIKSPPHQAANRPVAKPSPSSAQKSNLKMDPSSTPGPSSASQAG